MATIVATFSRSHLPNFMPLMVQLASDLDLGSAEATTTSTKYSHSGLFFLTAAAIADCKSALEIACRRSFIALPIQSMTTTRDCCTLIFESCARVLSFARRNPAESQLFQFCCSTATS